MNNKKNVKNIAIIIGVFVLILIGVAVSFKPKDITTVAQNVVNEVVQEYENNVADEKKNIVEENIIKEIPVEEVSNEVQKEVGDESKVEVKEEAKNKTRKESIVTEKHVGNEETETVSSTSESAVLPNYKEDVYGTSENGRNLEYYSIAPESYEDTFLFVFAIHGYEDSYDRDAQVLVNTAKFLVDYYKNADESLLHNNRLLIVACANPDGLYEGTSNNGFGRCNAKGIDLNRDFDIIYKVFTSPRNYTLEPFSAKESRALADFIKAENPKVVIDFHGWENCTIGDGSVAKAFKENMSLSHKTEFNNNCNGYFSYWAHSQGANALLVEFKNVNISQTNLRLAIDDLLEMF